MRKLLIGLVPCLLLAQGFNPLSAPNIPTSAGLFHWLAARGNTTQTIVIFGDSVSLGAQSGNGSMTQATRLQFGWAGLMTSALRQAFGATQAAAGASPGLITDPASGGGPDAPNYTWLTLDNAGANPWTALTTVGISQPIAGSPAQGDIETVYSASGTGAGYNVQVSKSPPTLPYVTGFTVITENDLTTGQCFVRVDNTAGSGDATVATSNPSTPTWTFTTVSTSGYASLGALPNQHFVSVGPKGSGQTCHVFGVIPLVGSAGLTVHNPSPSGASTNAYCTTPANQISWLAQLNPDLVIIALAINNFGHGLGSAAYGADLARCMTYIQAHTSASIALVWENPVNYAQSVTQPYRAQAYATATRFGAYFMDDEQLMGGYTAANAAGLLYMGGVHPTTQGHAMIAQYRINAFAQPFGVPQAGVLPSGSQWCWAGSFGGAVTCIGRGDDNLLTTQSPSYDGYQTTPNFRAANFISTATANDDAQMNDSQCTDYLDTDTTAIRRCKGSDGVFRSITLPIATPSAVALTDDLSSTGQLCWNSKDACIGRNGAGFPGSQAAAPSFTPQDFGARNFISTAIATNDGIMGLSNCTWYYPTGTSNLFTKLRCLGTDSAFREFIIPLGVTAASKSVATASGAASITTTTTCTSSAVPSGGGTPTITCSSVSTDSGHTHSQN